MFNGGGVDTDAIAPFLFRALRSDQALAVRPGAQARLAAALVAARQPPPLEPPAAIPPLARTISGARYMADDNPIGLRTLSLQFSGDRAHAALEFLGEKWNVPLGLRGRPIISTATSTGSPAESRDTNSCASAERYSARSMAIGSTRVACQTGMNSAIVAQPTRIATEPPRAIGSNGGTS